MKIGLRDGSACAPATVLGQVVLEDDRCLPCVAAPCDEIPVDDGLTQVELRRRFRNGYDGDGNPVFSWETLWAGGALVFETRLEWDAQAGVTVVYGDIKIPNPGLTELQETAMLVQPGDPEVLWMITGSSVSALSMDLKTRRIDA